MRLKTTLALLPLLAPLLAPVAFAAKDNPKACNCDTIILSDQEIADGCTDAVKKKTCPLYRETQIWKERLRQQHEERLREKRMQPLNIPRSK
ncbi:MAG: hypothetical protein P8126_04420 [Gammaproteobacteria bacterium]|jgi:hypothetical protein